MRIVVTIKPAHTSIYYVKREARCAVKAMAKLFVLLISCVIGNKSMFVIINTLMYAKVCKLKVKIYALGILISLNFYFNTEIELIRVL